MTGLRHDLAWLRRFPWFWGGLAVMTVLRFAWAAGIPFGNDEAYYWDWGRALQLSYFDHPPGVSWLAHAASAVFDGTLAGRGLVPLLHGVATILLAAVVGRLTGRRAGRTEALWLFAITQASPLLSLGGFFLMPDAGLIVALSWLTYMAVGLAQRPQDPVPWGVALGMGLALGLAGCFKYHALPLGGGLMLALIWLRRGRLASDLGPWALCVAVGVLACSPVWVWNWRNDFASFRFQSNHGFGGLRFNPTFEIQTLVAQTLLLTPLVFVGLSVWAWRRLARASTWREPHLLALGAFIPLFALLNGVGFFKQVLPHWLVPALWVVVPFFVADAASSWPRAAKANFAYGALVTLALPTLLAVAPWRQALPAMMSGKPGGLGELTLWDSLRAFDENGGGVFSYPDPDQLLSPAACPAPYALASLRWFWVAQLAANLEDHPKVRSLDLDKTDYYAFRDAGESLAGCPILVVGNEKHLDRAKLAARMTIAGERSFVLPDHQDQVIVKIWGIGK